MDESPDRQGERIGTFKGENLMETSRSTKSNNKRSLEVGKKLRGSVSSSVEGKRGVTMVSTSMTEREGKKKSPPPAPHQAFARPRVYICKREQIRRERVGHLWGEDQGINPGNEDLDRTH